MSKLVIIDGTNQFIRNYCVVPTASSSGIPTGGLFGFLRTMRFDIELCKPDRVIVVFDGPGGSQNRRAINQNYKAGRKPVRPAVNADIVNIEENFKWQFVRLFEYMDDLPVYRLIIENVEADDVISYVAHRHKDDEKVIVSSDRDFYQLLNDKTTIFNPTKRKFTTKQDCVDEFKIYPYNFAVVRSIVGDGSDNLGGIKGIGYKNVLKFFPSLSSAEKVSVSDVLNTCNQMVDNQKYKKFAVNAEKIKQNYQLMQLDETIISPQGQKRIDDILMKNTTLNLTSFKLKLMHDGISIINDRNFFDSFKGLVTRRSDGTGAEER